MLTLNSDQIRTLNGFPDLANRLLEAADEATHEERHFDAARLIASASDLQRIDSFLCDLLDLTKPTVDGICRFCYRTIIVDNYETWIDNTGGDVCPSASLDPGENRPHEPFETSYS